MSTIITYISNDPVSVKKAYDALMIRYQNDTATVLGLLKQNELAVTNADTWKAELKQNVEVMQEWKAGEKVLIGELRKYADIRYVVVQAHTTQVGWEPPKVPALFTVKPVPQPGQTYPDWKQPTGAQDAYKKGDKVHYVPNDLNYESLIDANVWSPIAYPAGWKQI
jgi:hypothetical protein